MRQTQEDWDRLHGSQYDAEMEARAQAERDRLHGDRTECRWMVPPVCTARWTQEDWDRGCLNPKHKAGTGN